MIYFSTKDVLKNLLIKLPWVKSIAARSHRTGIMNDAYLTNQRVDELSNILEKNKVYNATVLEIGPGQSSNTIVNL